MQVSRDTLGTKSRFAERQTTGSATRQSPHPPPLPAAFHRAARLAKAAESRLYAIINREKSPPSTATSAPATIAPASAASADTSPSNGGM